MLPVVAAGHRLRVALAGRSVAATGRCCHETERVVLELEADQAAALAQALDDGARLAATVELHLLAGGPLIERVEAAGHAQRQLAVAGPQVKALLEERERLRAELAERDLLADLGAPR